MIYLVRTFPVPKGTRCAQCGSAKVSRKVLLLTAPMAEAVVCEDCGSRVSVLDQIERLSLCRGGVNQEGTMEAKVEWVRIRSSGRFAHKECVEAYNSTIQCGAEHGDCTDPACAFSERYDESISQEAHKRRMEKKGGPST